MREVKSNLTEEISRYIGNTPLNVAEAYPIKSYRKLVEQVAKLAFFNKDHLLFFRGQTEDFRNKNNASTFYPTIYRGDYIPQREIVHRFDLLSEACRQLKNLFESSKI